MLDTNISAKIQEWQSDKYDESIRMEIKKLVDEQNEKELTDRFYKDLDFGTAGLRGVIGAGTNRMNIYTVGKAAQGLANYINKNEPSANERGIVIAYDSRQMSDVFSKRSALIFAGNGIPAYLFKSLRPVPILSFGIRQINAIAGVMVTASHNPPEYNGYKVSYSDGGQVIPPHDKGIIEEVRKIQSTDEIISISEQEAIDKGLLKIIGEEVDEAYYKNVLSLSLNQDLIKTMTDQPKIVYTPLHGAGNIPVQTTLKRWGFKNVNLVQSQEQPDGLFPTVKSPNPEESSALTLAIEQAKDTQSDLVLATDPDGDRVGIAVNNGNNEFQLFNGNQVGVIIAHYLFSHYKQKKLLPSKPLFIKSIVTTDLTAPICEEFGVIQEEVLTGFKYFAEKINQYHDLENNSKNFLFGFEESYGYLAGEFVRDKDAVSACCLISEICAFCKNNGKTLIDYLDDIYTRYGFYLEKLKSLTLKGKEGLEQIQVIMKELQDNPPTEIGSTKIIRYRDIQKGKIIDLLNNKAEQLDLPKSNVLTFYLENGGKITARPSGTEPKIKFYFSFSKKVTENLNDTKSSVKKELDQLIESFMAIINKIIS